MMKTLFTWFLLGVAAVMPVLSLLHPKDEILEDEKRAITPFPELPAKYRKSTIRQFFRQVDMFYMDRLEFRDTLISMASYLPKQNDRATCYEGKQNWLFLGNDYERTVDALTGVLKWDDGGIRRKTSIYADIQKAVEGRGAVFHMMVGPNKSTLYPEFLPETVKPARERFLLPLIRSLQETGVHVFDPTDALISQKDEGLLYWRTDTHWNLYGSYLALDAFMHHAGLPFLPPPANVTEGALYPGDLIGILGNKDYPVTPGDNPTPVWNDPLPEHLSDKKVLIIGDSFSEAAADYLAKVYPLVHRVHYKSIPRGVVEPLPSAIERYLDNLEFHPDIVLWIQVERAFAEYP